MRATPHSADSGRRQSDSAFTSAQLDQLEQVFKAGFFDATRGIHERIDNLKEEIGEIRDELRGNTEQTSEVLQIVATTKRGVRAVGWVLELLWRFLRWLGVQLKWCGPLIVALGAAWAWIKAHRL